MLSLLFPSPSPTHTHTHTHISFVKTEMLSSLPYLDGQAAPPPHLWQHPASTGYSGSHFESQNPFKLLCDCMQYGALGGLCLGPSKAYPSL